MLDDIRIVSPDGQQEETVTINWSLITHIRRMIVPSAIVGGKTIGTAICFGSSGIITRMKPEDVRNKVLG